MCSSCPFLGPWGASAWDLGVFRIFGRLRRPNRTSPPPQPFPPFSKIGLPPPSRPPIRNRTSFKTRRPIWNQTLRDRIEIRSRKKQTSDLKKGGTKGGKGLAIICGDSGHPRRFKTSFVGQSAGLSVPRSPVRFRQKIKTSRTQIYIWAYRASSKAIRLFLTK